MITKKITTENIEGVETEKIEFIEQVTEIKEIVWTKDGIDSQITQKQNTIDNLNLEIVELNTKLTEINTL